MMRRLGDACAVQWGGHALLLLAVYLYLDPFHIGYDEFRFNRDVGPAKYLLLLAGIAIVPIAALTLAARPAEARRTVMAACTLGWPLALLALYIICGSLYARVGLGIKESFLQFGLAAMGYLVAVLTFGAARDPLRLMRTYFTLLWLALLYVVPMVVIKRLQHGQAFHTEVFLILPLMIHAGLIARTRVLRWAVGLSILLLTFVLHKNLGYVSLGISAVYLGLVLRARSPKRRRHTVHRLLFGVGGLVAIAALVSAATFLAFNHKAYVPSGNPEVRLEVYEKAWARFLASPIYGDAFSGSSLTRLDRRLVLDSPDVTTHSDWLDVLSHGGIVGLLLIVMAIGNPLMHALRAMRRQPKPSALVDLMHVLVAMMLCGTIISMFVSLFISFPLAFLYWLHLGWLAAAAVQLDRSALAMPVVDTAQGGQAGIVRA
jgi:O-antigen ligase